MQKNTIKFALLALLICFSGFADSPFFSRSDAFTFLNQVKEKVRVSIVPKLSGDPIVLEVPAGEEVNLIDPRIIKSISVKKIGLLPHPEHSVNEQLLQEAVSLINQQRKTRLRMTNNKLNIGASFHIIERDE